MAPAPSYPCLGQLDTTHPGFWGGWWGMRWFGTKLEVWNCGIHWSCEIRTGDGENCGPISIVSCWPRPRCWEWLPWPKKVTLLWYLALTILLWELSGCENSRGCLNLHFSLFAQYPEFLMREQISFGWRNSHSLSIIQEPHLLWAWHVFFGWKNLQLSWSLHFPTFS